MSIRVDKFKFKEVRDGGFRNNEMKRTNLKNTTQPLFCHYFTITFPITSTIYYDCNNIFYGIFTTILISTMRSISY